MGQQNACIPSNGCRGCGDHGRDDEVPRATGEDPMATFDPDVYTCDDMLPYPEDAKAGSYSGGLRGLMTPSRDNLATGSKEELRKAASGSREHLTAAPAAPQLQEKKPEPAAPVAASASEGPTSSFDITQFAQFKVQPTPSKAPTPQGRPFPQRPMLCKLSVQAWDKIKTLFEMMDADGNNAVTKEKATEFFQSFKKVSADAMFNEVDTDMSGAITADEFMDFWLQVRASGYSEEQIMEEVSQILDGGTWVDWKDGRDTGKKKDNSFPKRPLFCKLSAKGWARCEELFNKITNNGPAITRSNAQAFFKGSFSTVSTDAMFNEVDVKGHGCITANEWMAFWVQVRGAGYSEKQIMEEMEELAGGGSWVDWKDSRDTTRK